MFSKKSDDSPAWPDAKPMATRNSASGSTFSIIGTDVTIKGDIEASADLHVDGHIEGDIKCSALVQGEGSRIDGGIEADSARLAGSVSGSITARELVILKSAKIDGDVHYDALTIEQGAEVEGRFAHRVPRQRSGDNPAEGEPKLSLAT